MCNFLDVGHLLMNTYTKNKDLINFSKPTRLASRELSSALEGHFQGPTITRANMLLHFFFLSTLTRLCVLCSSVTEQKTTVSILDDIGSMFDDLADQLDAMLE